MFLTVLTDLWGSIMTNYYVDPINGLETNNGTSRTTPKKYIQSITSAVAGDEVRIAKTPDPVAVGEIITTWVNGYDCIYPTLMSCLYMESFDYGWTFGTGVTNNYSSSWQRDSTCISMTTSSSCPTGAFALATKDFGSDQNWSMLRGKALTQISYWWYTSSAQTTGNLVIRFYDSSNNLLATFAPPSQTAVFQALLSDFGATLPNNVRYMKIEWTASTKIASSLNIRIDNMVACLSSDDPEFLWHGSLIGHSNALGAGGDDSNFWYCIQSIQSSYIVLDNTRSFIYSTRQGYSGVYRQSVQLYRRETAQVDNAQSIYCTNSNTVTKIKYSGGWDFSQNPEVQNGTTILDAMKLSSTTVFSNSSKHGIEISNLNVARTTSSPFNLNGNYCYFHDLQSYGQSSGSNLSGTSTSFKNLVASTSGYGGFQLGTLTNSVIENLTCAGCRGDSNNVVTGGSTITNTGIKNIVYINSGTGSSVDLYLTGSHDLWVADSSFSSITFGGTSKLLFINCNVPTPALNSGIAKGSYLTSIDHYKVPGRWKSWMANTSSNYLVIGDTTTMGVAPSEKMTLSVSNSGIAVEYCPIYLPVRGGIPYQITFDYYCSNADMTVTVSIYDNDWQRSMLNSLEVFGASVDNTETTYTSREFVPTRDGKVKLVLAFLSSSTGSMLGLSKIGLKNQVITNLGTPDILIDGKLSDVIINNQIEHSFVS